MGSHVFLLDAAQNAVGYAAAAADGSYGVGGGPSWATDDVLELFYETAAGEFSLPVCMRPSFSLDQSIDCSTAIGCGAYSADPLPQPSFQRNPQDPQIAWNISGTGGSPLSEVILVQLTQLESRAARIGPDGTYAVDWVYAQVGDVVEIFQDVCGAHSSAIRVPIPQAPFPPQIDAGTPL